MGHDIHFLTRLERLSDEEHLELAKSLYRDSSLLKHVLGRARLPEGAERAALSLGADDGPYLVVARDGHFVTCLGEGMSTGGLPVIARSHLDALAVENAVLRERLELVRKMAGGREESRLIKMLFRGRLLSREQFLALSALQPTFAGSLSWLLAGIEESVRRSKALILELTKREPQHLTHSQRKALTKTSDAMWAAGHIALLAASGRRDALEEAMAAGDPSPRLADSRRLFSPAMEFGELGIRMRAALAIAKVGKPCLAAAKRRFNNPERASDVLEGHLALIALSARHRALRAEIGKLVFDQALAPANKGPATRDQTLDALATMGEELLVLAGRDSYLQQTHRLASNSPYRFERKEEVPADLAVAMVATTLVPLRGDEGLRNLYLLITGAARRKPEELYLPEVVIDALHNPQELEPEVVDAWFSLRNMYERTGKREPVHIAPRPAGNARCSCGSGKKYKRCCGLAA